MRSLSLAEVQFLHVQILAQSGGASGIRSQSALESALAQPLMTSGGDELYPTIIEKAAALGFSLIMNHPFVDGNKRVGHAVMETFLILNGYEIIADIDEQERIILQLAAGAIERAAWLDWLRQHVLRIS
jgi:death-on-curing protein